MNLQPVYRENDFIQVESCHGVSVGEVIVGRPLKFGEHLRLVGFKETEQKIERMDKRADSLGMKRSDYLRWLVDKDLASVDVA